MIWCFKHLLRNHLFNTALILPLLHFKYKHKRRPKEKNKYNYCFISVQRYSQGGRMEEGIRVQSARCLPRVRWFIQLSIKIVGNLGYFAKLFIYFLQRNDRSDGAYRYSCSQHGHSVHSTRWQACIDALQVSNLLRKWVNFCRHFSRANVTCYSQANVDGRKGECVESRNRDGPHSPDPRPSTVSRWD